MLCTALQVLYVMRNPKDVFTSSFHYYGMASYLVNPGTQDEFMEKFLDGNSRISALFIYTPSIYVTAMSILNCNIVNKQKFPVFLCSIMELLQLLCDWRVKHDFFSPQSCLVPGLIMSKVGLMLKKRNPYCTSSMRR